MYCIETIITTGRNICLNLFRFLVGFGVAVVIGRRRWRTGRHFRQKAQRVPFEKSGFGVDRGTRPRPIYL